MQIMKSFTDIAERKMRELDQKRDYLEVNNIDEENFNHLVEGSVGSIFKDLISLHQQELKQDENAKDVY